MNYEMLRGRLDHRLGLVTHFYHWGSAMNGMTSRLETVRQIIISLKIKHIVETGTFRGTTAEWFSQFGIPFETVEISERYFAFSTERLKRFRNAKVHLGSSVPFLQKRISSKSIPQHDRQLFYLDSHWEKHLPLREELELIFNNYMNAVAIIDDFQVSDDPGYGFDNYSETENLTMPYLAVAKIPRKLHYFYPATRSGDETGMRRGWIVVTNNQDIADELGRISLLRRLSN